MRPSYQRCCTVRRPGQASARLLTLLGLMHFVRRSKKLGYCRPETPAVAELSEKADDDLFERITLTLIMFSINFCLPKLLTVTTLGLDTTTSPQLNNLQI